MTPLHYCLAPLRLILFFFLLSLATAAQPFYENHFCVDIVASTANSTYRSGLSTLMSSLSSNSTRSLFHNSSIVTATGQVIQGLYQCRPDFSLDTCRNSVSYATQDILQRCPNSASAVIWYDECWLRFSNESIFSVLSTGPANTMSNPNNVTESERDQFNIIAQEIIRESADQAANEEPKFVAKATSTKGNLSDVDQIYSLVQCTEDLSADDCRSCLHQAVDLWWPQCCDGRHGGRVFFPSCNFRYEFYAFYNTSAVPLPPPPPPVAVPSSAPPVPVAVPSSPPPVPVSVPSSAAQAHQSGNSGISSTIIVAVAALIGASILLFFAGFCFLRRRARKRKLSIYDIITARSDITDVESLQFNLGTIRVATNNFSIQNKLGEGGFGQVFKGTLANGQEIAVKRLSSHSRQGTKEFKNEVLLVAKLQHRNLARLKGFCLDGSEKILVYEFVPNKSLDYFLFDPAKRALLDWPQRYKIIGGIARGILYLHEDSRLRIIHRDLKASNILLDKDMNSKISDFGMARIFDVDQTRANTNRIVGTYGYMAPEYVIHGQFSVKSDIYSFGILVLEIVTGKKNSSFEQTDDSDYLVSYVWKHWRDRTVVEVLDPLIRESYSRNEVIRCVHIGLLCVQEDPINRPTMASVVLMMNSYSTTIAMPRQPAFFHSRTFQGIARSESSEQFKTKSILLSVDDNSITGVYPR